MVKRISMKVNQVKETEQKSYFGVGAVKCNWKLKKDRTEFITKKTLLKDVFSERKHLNFQIQNCHHHERTVHHSPQWRPQDATVSQRQSQKREEHRYQEIVVHLEFHSG